MTSNRLALAALAVLAATSAQAADPVGALDRSFAEYTGSGPIGNNNIQDNNNFFWFKEQSGTYLSQAVQSWFLIWDPRDTRTVTGTVTFDQNIVALMDDQGELIATGPAFGKLGVTYNYSNAAVGLESGDKTGTSYAGAVLTLDWNASNPGDHIRVLTAVPEPGTYALMAAGLAAIGLVVRRRRVR